MSIVRRVHVLPGVVLERDALGRLPSADQLRRAGFRVSTAVGPARDPDLGPDSDGIAAPLQLPPGVSQKQALENKNR